MRKEGLADRLVVAEQARIDNDYITPIAGGPVGAGGRIRVPYLRADSVVHQWRAQAGEYRNVRVG
jgi:hypothetical protein